MPYDITHTNTFYTNLARKTSMFTLYFVFTREKTNYKGVLHLNHYHQMVLHISCYEDFAITGSGSICECST